MNRNSVVNNSYGDPKPELHRNLDVSAMTINTTTVLDETASPSEEERYVLVQCSVTLIIIIYGTTQICTYRNYKPEVAWYRFV